MDLLGQRLMDLEIPSPTVGRSHRGTPGGDPTDDGPTNTGTTSATGTTDGGTSDGPTQSCTDLVGTYRLEAMPEDFAGGIGPAIGLQPAASGGCEAFLAEPWSHAAHFTVLEQDAALVLEPSDDSAVFHPEQHPWRRVASREWIRVTLPRASDGSLTGEAEAEAMVEYQDTDVTESPVAKAWVVELMPVAGDPPMRTRAQRPFAWPPYWELDRALPWSTFRFESHRPLFELANASKISGGTVVEPPNSKDGFSSYVSFRLDYWSKPVDERIIVEVAPELREMGGRTTFWPRELVFDMPDLSDVRTSWEGDAVPATVSSVTLDATAEGACAESGCLLMEAPVGEGPYWDCFARPAHLAVRLDPSAGETLNIRLAHESNDGQVEITVVQQDHAIEIESFEGLGDTGWNTRSYDISGATYAAVEIAAFDGCEDYDPFEARIDRIWIE